MFRCFSNLIRRVSSQFPAMRRNKSGSRPGAASKRHSFRPGVEALETRLALSSSPLHVAGNQLQDAANNPVVLRGVNVASLEWRTDGYHLMEAVNLYIHDWHANLLRLPVNEDFWFGSGAGDGGAAYRKVVDDVISTARANNVYVMLDLHWSNMGLAGQYNDQHYMPDDTSTAFWQSAAQIYKNEAAVLFDPYNEPHFASDQPSDAEFALWKNGGNVFEPYYQRNDNGDLVFIGNFNYHTPGMQGLIDTIRATGANNIVAPEGLNWGSNLVGVLGSPGRGITARPLSDATGNLMYQTHLYQIKIDDPEVANSVETLGIDHPIYVGEWGEGGVIGQRSGAAAAFNQQRLTYLDNHPNFSWTAWAMPVLAGNEYNLLTEWKADSTTPDYGVYVKDNLAKHANDMIRTPPTVVTSAFAAADPVTGTTTTLSVLGGDAGGEATLTYTWTTLNAPAGVTYSANGTSAAKNTTATFTSAGTYTFRATIRNASGATTTSDVTLTVSQTFSSIAVSPGSPSIRINATQQFTAQANDQFGNALAVQPSFTWSLVNGGGTISADAGLYQAPATVGTATVMALAGGLSGTATINIGPGLSATAAFADTFDWGTGFTGYITLTNTGNTSINGWTLEFDFTGNINEIWSAQIVSHVGDHYVIQNAPWNATIDPGQSIAFGFNADWGNPGTMPINYLLNGVSINGM